MEEDNDKIYYYTSNYVLLKWLENEEIWATRSVSSNDSADTTYAIKHFEYLEKLYDNKYKKNFENTKNILNATKNLSLRVYKNILKEFIANNFEKFVEITRLTMRDYKLFNAPVNIQEDKLELLKKLNIPFDEIDDGKISIKTRFQDKEEILFRYILSELSQDEIEEYLDIDFEISKEVIENMPALSYPYVICFSYDKDNRFLWESYTGNTGVCLEFSKKELEDYWHSIDLESGINNGGEFNLMQKVIYDDDIQKQYIKMWADILQHKDNFYNAEVLSFILTFCKSSYWKPENECRAVFGAKYFSDERFKVKENYNLKYNSGYKTQDYIEITFPKRLLKSITTGPMNSEENLKKYIREGLDRDIKNDAEKDNILEYFNKLKKEKSSGEGIIRK